VFSNYGNVAINNGAGDIGWIENNPNPIPLYVGQYNPDSGITGIGVCDPDECLRIVPTPGGAFDPTLPSRRIYP
jgi:hypothetical protein